MAKSMAAKQRTADDIAQRLRMGAEVKLRVAGQHTLEVAKLRKSKTIGFTVANGGQLAELVDIAFQVPSADTPRIQESHMTIGHIICELVE